MEKNNINEGIHAFDIKVDNTTASRVIIDLADILQDVVNHRLLWLEHETLIHELYDKLKAVSMDQLDRENRSYPPGVDYY